MNAVLNTDREVVGWGGVTRKRKYTRNTFLVKRFMYAVFMQQNCLILEIIIQVSVFLAWWMGKFYNNVDIKGFFKFSW